MAEIKDFKTAVMMGKVNGFRVFKAIGERESISTTVPGEDLTRLNELSLRRLRTITKYGSLDAFLIKLLVSKLLNIWPMIAMSLQSKRCIAC